MLHYNIPVNLWNISISHHSSSIQRDRRPSYHTLVVNGMLNTGWLEAWPRRFGGSVSQRHRCGEFLYFLFLSEREKMKFCPSMYSQIHEHYTHSCLLSVVPRQGTGLHCQEYRFSTRKTPSHRMLFSTRQKPHFTDFMARLTKRIPF